MCIRDSHKISHEGYLRHLLVRRAENTGEILVNLVTTSQEEWDLMPLVQEVLGLPLEGKVVGLSLIHISVAGIAYAVYRFVTPDYLEDFEDDFDDDFDDYFEDEDEDK